MAIIAASAGCNCTPAYVTGDRTGSITVTTNISLGQGTINNLVDGSLAYDLNGSYYWNVATLTTSMYVQFDFGSKTLVTEARLNVHVPSVAHGVWQWQGSDDAASWVDIGGTFTFGGHTTNPQTWSTLNGNETGYRYYRIRGVSGSITSASWITELEFKQCTC